MSSEAAVEVVGPGVRSRLAAYVALTKPRIISSRHGAAGIIKYPGSVRILENHGAIQVAELTGMRTKWRDFHAVGCGNLHPGDGSKANHGRDH